MRVFQLRFSAIQRNSARFFSIFSTNSGAIIKSYSAPGPLSARVIFGGRWGLWAVMSNLEVFVNLLFLQFPNLGAGLGEGVGVEYRQGPVQFQCFVKGVERLVIALEPDETTA